ncbi:tryptophan-rich sensory protein [Microbacterium sp.]|uniref:tryptophan-rich sensory protein n=1 Tax=Microbacterium sp. TaxID=51671 RepID=UPI003A8D0D89
MQPSVLVPSDRIRQVVVLVSLVFALVGAAVGSGAFGGTPIQKASGGALSATATPIAPAVPAFSIWGVIYLGLAAYAVWQVLPGRAADPRQRMLGYPVAASLLLNAAWILSVQAGLLTLSVVVIAVLLAVLAFAFTVCVHTRGASWVEAVLIDGVIGLYLGWACVATAANISAVLVAAGFTGWGIPADVWAVVVVAVAGVIGVALAIAGRGRIAPSLSLCWGLVWVGVARLNGEPHSVPAATSAFIAVAIVILATVLCRAAAVTRSHRS